MEERGFLVNSRGRRLYYCLHGAPEAPRGWVFCNPFLEEKTFSHPVYVSLARRLAERGEAVLRFDYEGDGDSEGDLARVSLGDWLADIESAARFLRERARAATLGLFGLRLGASLALRAAGPTSARRLLLWEPIALGADYLQELLRINLTTQLAMHRKVVENREQIAARLRAGDTVNIQGHEVNGRFAEEIAAIDLAAALEAAPCAVDVIGIRHSPRYKEPAAAAGVRNARVAWHLIEGASFWSESRDYDPAPAPLLDASLAALARGAA